MTLHAETFTYPLVIKEHHLDTFGHVNNATYLNLLEEARWELITEQGYGLKKIQQSGLGPTILEITLKFYHELRLRESIVISSQLTDYDKKVGTIVQQIHRDDQLCCEAKMLVGLFDLHKRKLVTPSDEWLSALGVK